MSVMALHLVPLSENDHPYYEENLKRHTKYKNNQLKIILNLYLSHQGAQRNKLYTHNTDIYVDFFCASKTHTRNVEQPLHSC